MKSVLNFLRFSGKLAKTNLGLSSLKISHFVGALIKWPMLGGWQVCVLEGSRELQHGFLLKT